MANVAYLKDLAYAERGSFTDSLPLTDLFLRDVRCMGDFFAITTRQTAPTPGLKLFSTIYNDLRSNQCASEETGAFMRRHMLPLCGLMPHATGPECSLDNATIAICEEAEPQFSKALRQITHEQWQDMDRISVYHNEYGRPFLFRKSTMHAATAVTIAPMRVQSLPIPPGTIVRPTKQMDGNQTGVATMTDKDRSWTYTTYLLPQPIELALGRISAIAYTSALDRQLFALTAKSPRYTSDIDSGRLPLLESLSLGAFQRAAQKVLAACGIRPHNPPARSIFHR